MFARIKPGDNIRNALLYNEEKLEQGKAECLDAVNFITDADKLTPALKLYHFERLISLNELSNKTSIHISLNFHPSEQLSNQQMTELAEEYMQRIGYKDQPYLVYRHHDAGHTHGHVVSTSIQQDGSVKGINYYESLKATQEMEISYSLVRSEKINLPEERLHMENAPRVHYGQSATKNAISDVLGTVVPQYKYTSLDELNAVLQLYNVRAEQTREDVSAHKHRGLMYRALDEEGKGIGIPIRASDFQLKPTLLHLEQRFSENESQREQYRQRVKTAIDWTMLDRSYGLKGFKEAMEEERISAVVLEGKKGAADRIYYVDHDTGSVFGGESLGNTYHLEGMRERCAQSLLLHQDETLTQRHRLDHYGSL